jgi:hypothetical protein
MKLRGKIICLTMLLAVSLMVTPALGSINRADQHIRSLNTNTGDITLVFMDCTGTIPMKKEITITKAEWISIRTELKAISASGTSMKDTLRGQFTVLQNHHLISSDFSVDRLLSKTIERINPEKIQSLMKRIHTVPLINNSLFSAMSATFFEIQNGTNAVFGLNSFINVIGFDIVSFHKGYAVDGIQTNGLISKSVPAGEYFGAIFGFFGYWFGEKVSTGIYSNVTVAGLSIVTAWLPIPLTP